MSASARAARLAAQRIRQSRRLSLVVVGMFEADDRTGLAQCEFEMRSKRRGSNLPCAPSAG
jgi:hypothetical protein